MKLVIVALCLVAVALAAPADPEPIKILRSEHNQEPEGGFAYSFETENGISQSATGELKQVPDEDNKPQSVVVFKGSYAYTDPEGKVVTITYVADETGFHPEGDSIPTVPARK